MKTTRTRTLALAASLSFGLAMSAALPQAAFAQFSDSYKFLESVRKGNVEDIRKAVEQPGVTPINTKDRGSGETALIITVGRRDVAITNYLLAQGARPDLTDNSGRSPLMVAVEKRFIEGAQMLLAKKANPNLANSSGETPLIRAVQMNDLDMVRLLMLAGADPNRRDTLAGQSAIDYARASSRSTAMMDALNAKAQAPRSKAVQGPTL